MTKNFFYVIQISAVAWIRNFNSPDVADNGLHTGRMIGTAAAISADGNPQHHAHRPLAVSEIARARNFREELIQAGPDVVGKLNFCDGCEPAGSKPDGEASDALRNQTRKGLVVEV